MKIKKTIIRSFLAVILPLVFANFAWSTIFRTVDKDGNVIFTDTRPEDTSGEEVRLRPITPMSPVSDRRPRASTAAEKKETATTYSRLAIIEPTDDTTVRGPGNFIVKIATEPRLLAGHKVRLMLDGKMVGKPQRGLRFELKNVDRGTHRLIAEVVDDYGTIAQSSSHTIHVHRPIVQPSEPAPGPVTTQ